MPAEELLTIKQVAAELGMANTRAMDLVRKGRLATALPRTAGPGTWRVARSELEAFLLREQAAKTAELERFAATRLRELEQAWQSLPEEGRALLQEQLPEIYEPLAQWAKDRPLNRDAALRALATEYGNRTEAGVEDLASAMPPDLFWAMARVAGLRR